MEENEKLIPYLCGGVLFNLLSNIKTNIISADKLKGKKNSSNDPQMFYELISIFKPSLEDYEQYPSMKTWASNYKKCKITLPDKLTLNSDERFALKSNVCTGNVSQYVNKMSAFINSFLNVNNLRIIVLQLLHIIDKDVSISPDDKFYISGTNQFTTKNELKSLNDITIETFLIGIVHYICSCRNGKNKNGVFTTEDLEIDQEDIYTNLKIIRCATTKYDKDEQNGNYVLTVPKHVDHLPKYYYKSHGVSKKNALDLINGVEPTITIDVNDPNFSIDSLVVNNVYHFECECSLSTKYMDAAPYTEVRIIGNGFTFIGFTTTKNWSSLSYRNLIVARGYAKLHGWFEYKYMDSNDPQIKYVQFYYLEE